jgi:hypothetical protein
MAQRCTGCGKAVLDDEINNGNNGDAVCSQCYTESMDEEKCDECGWSNGGHSRTCSQNSNGIDIYESE